MATASAETGIAYQTPHTYFFVPSDSGADATTTRDDVKTPGAFLRLGGYADIENEAKIANNLPLFYPRKHVEDEGGSAMEHAAGADPAHRGIALACSGRLLIRSAERVYVHSTGAMHIDTQSTFTLNADQAMTINSQESIAITSGEKQNITISAGEGTGDVRLDAAEFSAHITGKQHTTIKNDTHSHIQGNSTNITMGAQMAITLGAKLSVWIGPSLTVNMAADYEFSAATKLNFWIVKSDFGKFKIDVCDMHIQVRDGKVETSVWNSTNFMAGTGARLADASTTALRTITDGLSSCAAGVASTREVVSIKSGSFEVFLKTMMGIA
ncbi:hypothetical protein ACWGTO_29580 [Mesorhizobium sp. PL10]